VVIGMAVPAALPRVPGPVLLGVMDAEVISFEPSDTKIRSRDPAGEVPEVVVSNDGVRCILRACLDVIEAGASGEVRGNPVENFGIDGTGAGRAALVVRHRYDREYYQMLGGHAAPRQGG